MIRHSVDSTVQGTLPTAQSTHRDSIGSTAPTSEAGREAPAAQAGISAPDATKGGTFQRLDIQSGLKYITPLLEAHGTGDPQHVRDRPIFFHVAQH